MAVPCSQSKSHLEIFNGTAQPLGINIVLYGSTDIPLGSLSNSGAIQSFINGPVFAILGFSVNATGDSLYAELAGNSPLPVLNPFATYISSVAAPPTLSVQTVLNSPPVTTPSLAADGESALVLAYQSTSSQPVTFVVSAMWTGAVLWRCRGVAWTF